MKSESESEGRVERFRALYLNNYLSILGYALRRTSSEEDATDMVAETFLVLWRRLDDAPSGAETKPWLYGIARRVISNGQRSERRRSRLVASLLPPRADDEQHPSTESDLVSEAIERLSPTDREVLRLFVWEDLTVGEIATALGCSANAAKVRLHRARKRLAVRLQRLGMAAGLSGDERFEPVTNAAKEELG